MIRFLPLAGAAYAALAVTPLAFAQVEPPLDDVVIQGEVLNRVVDQAASAPRGGTDGDDDEIDGEAGIYLLTVNDIFFVSGSAGLGYTTNPTRTATDDGDDWYGDVGASIGVSTRLAGAVDFSAALSVDGRDYFEADTASSRSVSITTAMGAPIFGGIYGSAIAFVGSASDDQFHNRTGFYGVSGILSTSWKVSDQLVFRPGAGITQQWSDVSENNSLTATASVDAVYALSPEWYAAGRVSVSKRSYSDFYEDVTFVERDDTTVGLSASLVWRPSRAMAVSASVTYENQDSTFFLSSFEALDTHAGISLRQAF